MSVHVKHLTAFFLVALITCAGAHAAERVVCPEGLKWTNEGFCKVELDVKMTSCPQRSKMAKPRVTGPLICRAAGDCPAGTSPNSDGLCVTPEEMTKKKRG
jgi:hypothetical protein